MVLIFYNDLLLGNECGTNPACCHSRPAGRCGCRQRLSCVMRSSAMQHIGLVC